jgi:hypothetical protein
MSRKLFLLLLFLITSFKLFSQRTILVGAQSDLGVPLNSFSMGKRVLKSHLLSYDFQGSLSAEFQFWDRIGIELGASQTIVKWRLKDKDFESRHPGFVVDMRSKSYFYGGFANLRLLQPISSTTKFYLLGGYSLNQIGAKTLSQTRAFVMDNENVTSTSEYQPQSGSINAAVGLQFDRKHSLFNIGLKATLGRQNIVKGSYITEKDGQPISQDNFFSKGSFIGLSLKYAVKVYHQDKKVKVITPKAPPVVTKPATVPQQVEGRKINVTNSITVAAKKVTVKVWDHQTVDGDRISINLNGRWILENYTLEKQQHVFEVELAPGKNIFVLHALNLGKIPPNTAAIIVYDGVKEQRIILESTLDTSGTIEVTYNP